MRLYVIWVQYRLSLVPDFEKLSDYSIRETTYFLLGR